MWTILKISWLSLRRDRVALALTFLLPLVFFSIFALVFGQIGSGSSPALDAAVVLEEQHASAIRLREILMAERGMRPVTVDIQGDPLDREAAVKLVQRGHLDLAIVIPEGFSAALSTWREAPPEVHLYSDNANPLAQPLAVGLIQAGTLQLGYESLVHYLPLAASAGSLPSAPTGELPGPVRIQVDSVLGGDGKRPSVAFFAAGIGVLFLLFTVSGRSAILIEERESGVLTRLLATRLRLRGLLLGRWLFLALLGFSQVTLMFVWGSLAFGLELWTPRHLSGFVVMAAVTAAAAAAFGLLLATCCRSRAQLNGVSAVLILIMSAIGGSMFPRFLMPEQLQRLGLLTFNAWALDGFQKVFWYEAGVRDLWPQLLVLLLLTLLFLVTAEQVANRWQRQIG